MTRMLMIEGPLQWLAVAFLWTAVVTGGLAILLFLLWSGGEVTARIIGMLKVWRFLIAFAAYYVGRTKSPEPQIAKQEAEARVEAELRLARNIRDQLLQLRRRLGDVFAALAEHELTPPHKQVLIGFVEAAGEITNLAKEANDAAVKEAMHKAEESRAALDKMVDDL